MIFMILAVAGCGRTKRSEYYLLTAGNGSAAASRTLDGADITIGIGPIEVADYLDRAEVVSRDGANRLEVAEFHRWGEPLGENIHHVLIENLTEMLPDARIIEFPWHSAIPVDYLIAADFDHFEASDDGYVALSVRWRVLRPSGPEILFSTVTAYRDPVAGEGYEPVAAGMSAMLARLSVEMVEAVSGIVSRDQ
jgi:uncharacterized lipoprotein YmbA